MEAKERPMDGDFSGWSGKH